MKYSMVGTYTIGRENVRLGIADCELIGMEAFLVVTPDDGGPPLIVLGGKSVADFKNVLSGLMHESLEFCLHRRRLSYSASQERNASAADFLFVLNHEDMNCIADNLAMFLCECLEPLKRKWREINRPRKGKKKGKKTR